MKTASTILCTLYKRNSKGQLQQWSIHVKDNTFWAEYGLVGGKIQADIATICEGKNIGRANETTANEQALLEANSKIKKQRDKGYSDNPDDCGLDFTPMLSHDFHKHGNKLPMNVIVSPKLDGMRCYISKDGAFTRNGKEIVAAKFILQDLFYIFEKYPDLVLDGEIYNHKYKDDFNKIISLSKKRVNILSEDWAEIESELEYHIFDAYFFNDPSLTFRDRKNFLESLELENISFRLKLVEQTECKKEEIDSYHEQFLEQGYEGIMVRDPESIYEQKRSYKLQKYKNFQDEEFEVIGLEEGKGNWAGKCMKFICKTKGGVEFEAVPKGTEDYRKSLLENKQNIIGKMATVKFQNYTPDGSPRFGIVLSIRDYE